MPGPGFKSRTSSRQRGPGLGGGVFPAALSGWSTHSSVTRMSRDRPSPGSVSDTVLVTVTFWWVDLHRSFQFRVETSLKPDPTRTVTLSTRGDTGTTSGHSSYTVDPRSRRDPKTPVSPLRVVEVEDPLRDRGDVTSVRPHATRLESWSLPKVFGIIRGTRLGRAPPGPRSHYHPGYLFPGLTPILLLCVMSPGK